MINVKLLNTVLSPNHLVYYTNVALDNAHHFGGNVFIYIIRNGNARFSIFYQFYCNIYALEQTFSINAAENETAFVQSFRTLSTGADADGREWMTNAGEEAALLRQGAAVAHHGKGIHLKAVVVVESQRLVLDHS